jgi:hypothetical protein
MKKGLLGLLVVALTVVGCQNYDDQFDSLNDEITKLQGTVDGLTAVATQISDLDTKLTALEGTVLTDGDLTEIIEDVAAVQSAVNGIDVSGIEDEVLNLETEVDEILERLSELLAANAVIQGPIIIRNEGDLTVVEDLIGTEADDPLVTIQGNVIVEVSATNELATETNLARVNAVLGKFKIVQGTTTITTSAALDVPELMYVSVDYDVAGTGSVGNAKLRTVTGNVTVDLPGAVSFPVITTAADFLITQTATVTSVDTNGVAARTASESLILPNATSVKVGGVLQSFVVLDSATEFVSAGTLAQTSSTITIGGANATLSIAATTFSDTVTITTTGDISLPSLTSITALGLSTSAGAADLSGLSTLSNRVGMNDSLVVSATSINLNGLTSNVSATIVYNGPQTTLSLPLLTVLGGPLTATSITDFSAPLLATTTGTIDIANTGATVELKGVANVCTVTLHGLADKATIQTLTLGEQAATADLDGYVAMQTLNYTGAIPTSITPGSLVGSNNLLLTSSLVSLTTVNIGDGAIGTLQVSQTPLLESLTTAGHIIHTYVVTNPKLATFDFSHRYADGDDACTVSVTGNVASGFTALSLASLGKVKSVEITGNTSLTTITAPDSTVLAEPVAPISVIINSNDTAGTWSTAVSATETTPATPATASSDMVSSFKPFIEAYLAQTSRTATVTFAIDVDNCFVNGSATSTDTLNGVMNADAAAKVGVDGDATTFPNQTDGIGGVNNVTELALY